jgi:hypothetical protein
MATLQDLDKRAEALQKTIADLVAAQDKLRAEKQKSQNQNQPE